MFCLAHVCSLLKNNNLVYNMNVKKGSYGSWLELCR